MCRNLREILNLNTLTIHFCLAKTTLAGLEPTRDRPNRFLVGRLNNSATVSLHPLTAVLQCPGHLSHISTTSGIYVCKSRVKSQEPCLLLHNYPSIKIVTSLDGNISQVMKALCPYWCFSSNARYSSPSSSSCSSLTNNAAWHFS